MKISVIVAAYNAEKYLEETLDSLLHQSMDDYELIVVNDGSEDDTLAILREYEEEFPIMTVIDQENGGPSAARNAGLDVAKGDYVFFFDADDILESDALRSLYERAVKRKADLVIAKYDIFDRFRTYPVNSINKLVTMKKISKYEPQILWTFSLCNKLFRRSIIEEYSMRLAPISYSEDGAFLMEYVYHTKRITGLDKVIFHYRRLYDGVPESITASVSPSKIHDYIEAHRLILESAERSLLSDYSSYNSLQEIMEKNEDIHKYISEIIRKELQILLGQFYVKYWDVEEETVRLLADEIKDKMKSLDMRDISILQDAYPEFSLFRLPVKREEAFAQAHFTVALYGDASCEEDFLNSLNSLLLQNLVTMVVVLPSHMREVVEREELLRDNQIFVDVKSEDELFYHVIETAKTPYVTFGNTKIAYANNAFKYAMKNFIKSPGDFLIELIYHRNYGDIQAVLLNRKTLDSLKLAYENNPYLCMDNTLANKFFKVEFLRKFHFDKSKPLLSYLPTFYDKGYYPFMNDGVVLYEDKEEEFINFVGTKETIPFMQEYLREKPADLNSPELKRNLSEVLTKLIRLPQNNILQVCHKKVLALLKKGKVKNQVLFYTIRKDGELEGNAKALYPYVKGKKVIAAKMGPHNLMTELKMFYQIYTSKVIVTDDYVRYLKNFHLREDQRVVQLWHACGAFKKFGQRGTNMAIYSDHATHIQYNLVTVSGSSIRGIYADAFDIDVGKVKSLGCPRTDYFFDEEWIKQTKKKIYDAHPEWEDKEVIIYAPTFRDINEDRTEFHPELDFEQLSEDLLPNQLFLICPHPVMKNEIVDKEYDNIKVVREFSTNDLMHISDMLITDYSSVIFEYSLLRKPIAFYCYDLVNYNRGFYLNYPDDLPGDVYENQKALTEFITTPHMDDSPEKYTRFVEKYMSGCDGHSAERIAAIINDFMEGEDNA